MEAGKKRRNGGGEGIYAHCHPHLLQSAGVLALRTYTLSPPRTRALRRKHVAMRKPANMPKMWPKLSM